ncbi:MAG: hypothetical protein NTX22_17595 [Ignavibacteriales bacterium]|nr:hypothetical protein [Ignavibacteriales bacterium]
MSSKKNPNKIGVSIILFLIVGLMNVNVYSQSKKEIMEKLKKLDGDVNKITITSDKGEVSFEGKEAKKIFDLLASKEKVKSKKVIVISDDGDSSDTNDQISCWQGDDEIIMFDDEDSLVDKFYWKSKSDDMEGKNIEKKIKVDVVNGVKEVTVTTTEDGKEKVDVYKGEEAEKFLKDTEKEAGVDSPQKIRIKIEKNDCDEKTDHIIIKKINKKKHKN